MGRGNVLAVIDGQWGSTGKGVICAYLAKEYNVHVRVGAPNAGHSYKIDGEKFVHQSVPVGWCNPDAYLVVGRGALINVGILAEEVRTFSEWDPGIRDRLIVDEWAGVISPWHVEEEGHTQGEIHRRIGSTGEGVGAARRDRMSRDPYRFQHFRDVAEEYGLADVMYPDTSDYLHEVNGQGANILLEGSQGSGLDLIHGTEWPYVTSNGTGVAQLAADIGFPPRLINQTLMVARRYPIRVAGNSGPMGKELSFEEISRRIGRPVTESTTVTKKTRRIGEWNWEVIQKAVRLNAPTSLAITFLDYHNPEDEGVSQIEDLSMDSISFLDNVTTQLGVDVSLVGTGGPDWSVVDVRDKEFGL